MSISDNDQQEQATVLDPYVEQLRFQFFEDGDTKMIVASNMLVADAINNLGRMLDGHLTIDRYGNMNFADAILDIAEAIGNNCS